MYLADLHLHSKYLRATSRNGDLPNLDFWARRKGVALLGTGDFTHPAYREEMHACLIVLCRHDAGKGRTRARHVVGTVAVFDGAAANWRM